MSEVKPTRTPRAAPTTASQPTELPTQAVETPEIPRVSAPPIPAMPSPIQNPYPLGFDAVAALCETQATLMRGAEALADEMSGLIRAGIATTTASAAALLGVKTLTEAIEIQTDFARRGVDTMLAGATKVSGIGAKFVADAFKPLLGGLGDSRMGARTG